MENGLPIVTWNELTERLSDNDLLKTIQSRIAQAEYHETQAREWRESVVILQAELARRQLEALWVQYPGLRLEVGDKLLVTEELFDYRERQGGWPKRGGDIQVNTECKICSFVTYKDELYVDIVLDGYVTGVIPFPIARRMRQAWLQAHGEAVE